MAEYFDVSFITKKENKANYNIDHILYSYFGLVEGINNSYRIDNNPIQEEVLLTFYDDENVNFDETCISFSNITFHKQDFYIEIQRFKQIVRTVFENYQGLIFAVCSYEINGYLLGSIKDIKDFDERQLKKFPIVFKKNRSENMELLINLEAQDVFLK